MKKIIEGYSVDQISIRVERLAIFCTVYGMVVGYLLGKEWYFALVPAFLILLALMYRFALRWGIDVVRFVQGIRGEIKVGAVLAQLPQSDYWYSNDIVLPGARGNIDHVVVGPTGVWLVETRHWDGKWVRSNGSALEIDGRRISNKELPTLRGRAGELQSFLSASFNEKGASVDWVQPVLVFSTDGMKVEVKNPVSGVYVLGFREVADFIQRGLGRAVLSREHCMKIRQAIETRHSSKE